MASPFALRLGTNYCPTDEEVFEIQDLLLDPTLRLKGIGDEIAKLQTAIDKLAEERDSLEAYVEVHKALISPVRRLPLDIIQEIFLACLPTHRNCVMSAAEAPVLFGRICSSWRTISLSTPRLWARLHVVEPHQGVPDPTTTSFEQKVAQRLEITKTWLGRAGQCPLSISLQSAPEINVEVEDGTSRVPSPNSVQFLQALISFAPRWQHINFTTPSSLLLQIMSYLDIEMPSLETVAFNTRTRFLGEGPVDLIDWGPFNMFRGTQLSSVSIPGSMFIPERLPLAWNQLTTLTINGPSWTVPQRITSDALLPVLSCCPELRCFKLVVNDANTAVPILQHPIVELPFLHTLAIHSVAYAAPAVEDLLKRLSVPELRDFAFFGSMQDSPPLVDFFAGLLRLDSIDVDFNLFSKPTFLETLNGLPSTIQRLAIRQFDDMWGPPGPACLDDDAVGVLTSPGVCPALQHLSITHGSPISEEAVLRFITARMLASPPMLKRVNIHFNRQRMLDIMPDLQAFIGMGLDVTLTHLQTFPSSQFLPGMGWQTHHRRVGIPANGVPRRLHHLIGSDSDNFVERVRRFFSLIL
ncbi:hypothetical protein K438DRAFT_1884496 [Mycena galopus ATCC 62051]|nr:hypothetical protein K438DRAFT_1884496 [Mycena galopus ATCC 62051]